MTRRKMIGFALLSAVYGVVFSTPALAQPAKDAAPINIGLVKAFFNDVDPTLISIAVEPFGKLMKDAVGLEGRLDFKDDAFEIARKLDKGDLQVGVFHGHEFAWIQKKHPALRPLMIAHNQFREVKAYVIVHKDNPATSVKDLRGKTFDIPVATKEHCRVFIDKACGDNNVANANAFFKSVAKSKTSIAAMDNVCFGKMDAVLIDTISLEFYKEIKGPSFKHYLRVLAESHSFPAPVIVYKDGALNEATLQKFRTGLAEAHKNPDGEDILRMWQIHRFEPLPTDYSKSLAVTLERYPAPTASKARASE